MTSRTELARRLFAVVVCALALVASSCGSADDSDSAGGVATDASSAADEAETTTGADESEEAMAEEADDAAEEEAAEDASDADDDAMAEEDDDEPAEEAVDEAADQGADEEQTGGVEGDGTIVLLGQDLNAQPRDAIVDGGEFRYPLGSLSDNWNGNHPVGNSVDNTRVMSPMSPRLFLFTADGDIVPDTEFLLDATMEPGPPMVVTYQLNPEWTYNNGETVSVADFQAFWQANSGADEAFEVVSTEGYNQIVSVEQGADEFEVVVTFESVYADWTALFGAVPHRDGTSTAEAWNEGWLELSDQWLAGPFSFGELDEVQQTVELVPNANWWGDAPKLDRMLFRVIDSDAQPQAFANGEIDALDIGPDPDGYAIASGAPQADVRAGLGPSWRHITMNHTAGLIAELPVRTAIAQGLNRGEIAESDLAGIPLTMQPLNNRILMANQGGYTDNADGFTYDPAAARATLEADGWVEGADGVYERDGERLTVSFTEIGTVPVSENEARQVQAQLADVGIEVEIVTVSTDEWVDKLVGGEFQMIAFTWVGSPYPFAGVGQLYGTGSDSNFGFSDIPDLDALVEPIGAELDPQARIDLANQADRVLWENMHTLPLYQRPDLYAVDADFANFGAFGLYRFDSSAEWENIGWTS